MINLNNVTLVSMSSINIDGTVSAMKKSCQGIKYGDIKIITHEKPPNLPNDFKFCQIDRIGNLNEYSYKMIYDLDKYIDTEFALIVQYDGWVINPNSWRNQFLEYDYIGAPFGMPTDNFSMRDIYGNIFRVGNGGFSLRSKRLIELPNKLKLEWRPFHGFYNEDGFICAMYRHIYIENGLKFAPLDVAKYFAHEANIPEINGIDPFGFHGKWSKYNK